MPFSWTLRWARANRLRVKRARPTVSYRIVDSAPDATALAAAITFCSEHGAALELD